MYCHGGLKLIFVAVPKNASRSIAAAICERGFQRIGQHHSIDIEEISRRLEQGWRSFACIRNPFSRAVSQWDDIRRRSWGAPELEALHQRFQRSGFPEFARLLATGELPRKLWSQSRFLAGVPVSETIRVESLESDLARLVGPVTLPRKTAGEYGGDWRRFYTPAAIEHVKQWAADDFRTLGDWSFE